MMSARCRTAPTPNNLYCAGKSLTHCKPTDPRPLTKKSGVGYPNCDTSKKKKGKNKNNMTMVTPDLYVFCSPPRAMEVSDISGAVVGVGRPKYRDNEKKPRGVHSYYNLMWDGRIRRGTRKEEISEENECQKIRERLNRPRRSRPLSEKLKEMKAKLEEEMSPDNLAIKEIQRYATLRISNLVKKDTEHYLVGFNEDADADPCRRAHAQPCRDFIVAPGRSETLEEKGTQIYVDDFFDFEGEAQPMIERLVGQAVYQAHLELLDEEELLILQKQEALHLEKLQTAANLTGKCQQREILRQKELERQKLKHTSSLDDSALYHAICSLSGTLTSEAMQECMTELLRGGFLPKSEEEGLIRQEFLPWLNDAVEQRVNGKVASTLVDMIIGTTAHKREEEYAEGAFKEQTKKKYEQGGQTKPPPTPGISLAEDSDSLGIPPDTVINQE